MTRLAETVRVGTSQACVLHGHPKKAGSATDKLKGSEIKCYPFSGEGGRAGATKKAYAMHYAITKSQERGESTVPPRTEFVRMLSYRGHKIALFRRSWNGRFVTSNDLDKKHFDYKKDYSSEDRALRAEYAEMDRLIGSKSESCFFGMRRLQEVLSGSEALYGFCGWLTSRKEKTVMSSSDEAGHIADLVDEFSKMQGLPAPREDWDKKELISMNPVRRKADAKSAGKFEAAGELIASASTEEKIISMISQFYGGSTISLRGQEVSNKNGPINGVRVVFRNGRFRFERGIPERGENRLEAVLAQEDIPALMRGIHFKSKDWAEANEFSLSRRFPMVVMKGDDDEFWVVRPDDGERLAKAGYDYAR